MRLQNDLTEGRAGRRIVGFAIPLILSNIFQVMYNAVDMFFVGRYSGEIGLSAVASAGTVVNVAVMTVSGLSVGVSIVLGEVIGQGRDASLVKRCAYTAASLYLALAALASAAGIAFAPQLLRLVKTPAVAEADAVLYLRTIAAGMAFTFGYNLICAIQRGFGDSRTSLYFVIVATMVNIALDYVLVCVYAMGAFGAAIATVCAQMVSMAMGIVYFNLRRHVITFAPREFCIDRPLFGRILYMGLPAAFQQMLIYISGMTLTGLANTYGVYASAGYGIVSRLDSFILLTPDAIGAALASFASQNVGARKPERALAGLKESLILSNLTTFPIVVGLIVFTPNICGVFAKDPDVVAAAAGFMRIYWVSYMWLSSILPLIGFVRGTGNSIYTMIAVIVAQYAIRIPLSFLFAKTLGYGLNGIAIASSISPVSALALYSYAVLSGRWRKRLF